MVSIVLKHSVWILLHFLQFLKSAIGLLERISSHDLQILLKKIDIFIGISFLLSPFNFKPENTRALCKNISAKIWKRKNFWWFKDVFIILVSYVVSASEKFLLFVRDWDDDCCGSWIIFKYTYYFFFWNLWEIWTVRLNCELHDSWSKVLHVELINSLIELRVVGRSDVNYFPVEGARKRTEALKGNVEREAVEYSCWIVPDLNVVDVNLSHLARLQMNINIIAKSHKHL